jgi:protein gp37
MYDDFGWNPEIRFVPSVFNKLPKKPVRVFVGSTMELFLFDDWMEFILNRCQDFPQHTFQFLTKKPEKLPQWSPFPENCWVGATTTGYDAFNTSLDCMKLIEAKVKYFSIEPFLERIQFYPERLEYCGINWLIIGALTGRKRDIMELSKQYPDLTPMPWGSKWTLQPKIEWVEEIVRACDKAGVPVFLKDNLMPLMEASFGRENYLSPVLTPDGELRQELPCH